MDQPTNQPKVHQENGHYTNTSTRVTVSNRRSMSHLQFYCATLSHD